MANPLFVGSGVAIITPFTKDGIDFDSLGKLIEFQIENHTDAIIICGTTGEASTMTNEEHLATIKYAVDKTAGRIPVIAGTGSNDTAHCVDLSIKAQEMGADGLLLSTPYYNKATQKGLELHFKAVADAVDIPIILYNIPGRTGMSISIACAKELAKHKNIVAMKEASGDISYVAKLAAACGDQMDIYSGNDDMIVPMLSLGAKGVISVLANVLPQETHDMVHTFINGDAETSRKLQLDLLDLINALFIEVNPIPVKTALNLMGMNGGLFRMPLCEMTEKNLSVLKETLKAYKLV